MAIFRTREKPRTVTDLGQLQAMLEGDRPVLVDFFQVGCGPCKVMDGIVNELAEEYAGSAEVVKVDVTRVAGAAQAFGVRSTPTFVLLGRGATTKRRRRRTAADSSATPTRLTPRWRASGLVRKDQLRRVLESNGASPAQ
ncbi:MAG: thioredoxin domain-containing protein [Acidimicrobiia bacterium]|nr:thioredoxin domain-containing protein [Acidimicrobiia bacterium]